MQEIKVAILTPYLTESLQSMVRESPSKKWLSYQVEKAAYSPNNLSDMEIIQTKRNKVRLLKAKENEDDATLCGWIKQARNGFSISGSTKFLENLIRTKKGTGALVARYSIFYSKPSEYTGRSSEESGYAFDIPKNPEIVKAMLNHDDLLEAIVERKADTIQRALKEFNRNRPKPILATSYLPEALALN